MKTLATSILLLSALMAHGQVTNVEVRYTINGDVALRTTLNLSGTNKNENAMIQALVWQHGKTGGTNTLHNWAAKTWTRDNLTILKDAKDEQDVALKKLREDVEFVIKFQAEDLTPQMKTNLEAIAALKPVP